MAAGWSLDFCLSCDRQTSGEAYCSQQCRLEDLERSSPSTPSASSPQSAHSQISFRSPFGNQGFSLPPAFDFSAYRHSSLPTSQRSSSSSSPLSSALGARHGRSSSTPKVLTPSSSQASLASVHTSASFSTDGLTRQAELELREYTNSFDQVRDQKRRMTAS